MRKCVLRGELGSRFSVGVWHTLSLIPYANVLLSAERSRHITDQSSSHGASLAITAHVEKGQAINAKRGDASNQHQLKKITPATLCT
jgi:hypothetical protein